MVIITFNFQLSIFYLFVVILYFDCSSKTNTTMNSQHHFIGLSEQQVADSRAKYGINVLTPPPTTPLWKQFLEKFRDPLIIILLIAGVLSVAIPYTSTSDCIRVLRFSLSQ